MSDFTQFELETPIVTPPVPEKVYDKGWIDMLTITSPAVNACSIYAKFVPCRDNLDTGDKELKPVLVDGDTKIVQIPNVWEIVGTNPKFAMAFELVFQALLEYGQQQGIFKKEEVPVEPVVEPEVPVEP